MIGGFQFSNAATFNFNSDGPEALKTARKFEKMLLNSMTFDSNLVDTNSKINASNYIIYQVVV